MGTERITIRYFTDPLCCWSWGFEPQWRKLVFRFKDYISYRYVMSGLLPSWKMFIDYENSISKPSQMGPLWMHAEKITGMPTASTLWQHDPPSSSFPSCIAVHCAFLQSFPAGEFYLRKTRESCFLAGKNISKNEVLFDIAEEVAAVIPAFNYHKFYTDFTGEQGKANFRADWQESRRCGIEKFPTLLISNTNGETFLMSGYKSFAAVAAALTSLAPELETVTTNQGLEAYRNFWHGLTFREESEFLSDYETQLK